MIRRLRSRRLPALSALVALAAGGVALAQIEGGDRGVPPIDSTSNYEVSGVAVDVVGKTADAARTGGWREAQRRGWQMLWARVHGSTPDAAPRLPDSTLDSIVSGVVVEDEEIGSRRYIARLGILFDRSRTGALLGVHGGLSRSAPMLVIPVEIDGAVPLSFESRTEWQRAWARFRAGTSPVDYVRPVGAGADPLLLNLGQVGRRGRGWWRMLLDQYGAADIVSPQVRLERLWPGGPIIGHFSAFHGPDAQLLGRVTLRVETADALPALLDDGVKRLDEIYVAALRDGRLTPDPTLVIEEPEIAPVADATLEDEAVADDFEAVTATVFTLQIDTPDAQSITATEAALRGVPGVRSASATSLAVGGVSLFRVAYEGDPQLLRTALGARGWRVEGGDTVLRLRRGAPSAGLPEVTGGTP